MCRCIQFSKVSTCYVGFLILKFFILFRRYGPDLDENPTFFYKLPDNTLAAHFSRNITLAFAEGSDPQKTLFLLAISNYLAGTVPNPISFHFKSSISEKLRCTKKSTFCCHARSNIFSWRGIVPYSVALCC